MFSYRTCIYYFIENIALVSLKLVDLTFDYGHTFTSKMNFVVRFKEKCKGYLHEIFTEYRHAIVLYNVKNVNAEYILAIV